MPVNPHFQQTKTKHYALVFVLLGDAGEPTVSTKEIKYYALVFVLLGDAGEPAFLTNEENKILCWFAYNNE